jgi:hypothetical protein
MRRPSGSALRASTLLLLCAVSAIGPAAAAGSNRTSVNDVRILCNALDHEIFGDLMTYQLVVRDSGVPDQHAFVRRLAPAPPLNDIREDTVFAGPAVDLGGGLARIEDSANGPEFGLGSADGTQVVYTSQDPLTHNLYIGRSANSCPDLGDGCWVSMPFANVTPEENRWHTSATLDTVAPAKIVYTYSPGPRDTDVHIAYRDLEDPDLSHEHVINDPKAVDFSHWVLVNGEYFIMLQYGPEGGDQQAALYDVTPPYQRPRVKVMTSGPGVRTEGWVRFDPASGRYTLITVNQVGGISVMEIYQRIAGVWTHLYDINAAEAGETNPELAFLQSPEPFVYRGRLYVAFVTSDTGDFATLTRGNIRITRLDPGSVPPTFFKLLNDDSVERKRLEPEIHFPTNDSPVVYYMQRAAAESGDGCAPNSVTLRRARTGLRRPD